MNPDVQYQRIKDAFLVTWGLTAGEREQYLQKTFGDDTESRNRVLHLLSLAGAGQDSEAPEELPSEPGFLLDRYRIEARLAQGGHGAVYLAEDSRVPGRKVAIKIVEGDEGSSWNLVKFQDEVRSLARVDHPGVVGLIDFGETAEGLPFLLMHYVPGETLRSRMRERLLTAEEVIPLIDKLADALTAIHEAGVIHRDLKPENVILRPDGQPVIVDLGIASFFELGQPDRLTPPAGSSNYLSPEARLGRPTRRSDVFSLAVMAAEMSGPSASSERVRKALAKGMAASEAERYGTARQFAAAFRAASQGTYRPWRSAAIFALTLVAAAVLALLFHTPQEQQDYNRTPGGTTVTPGNLLVPVVKPNAIQEFDPRNHIIVREFSLPREFTMDHTVPSVLVRKRDSAILINARDAEARPVILEFSSSGMFRRAQQVPGLFAQPLIFDPADPSGDTVLTSLTARPRIVAVDMRKQKTKVRLELGWGQYLALAVDSRGDIYAVDFPSGKIRRFSAQGQDKGIFAEADKLAATSLSIDEEGNLYLAEARLRRILKFSNTGRLVLTIESPLQLQAPHAIFYNPDDHLLYAGDWASPGLVVFSTHGDLLSVAEMNGRAPSVPGLVPRVNAR